MKVMFQGKEIELEEATDEQMSLDYATPVEPYEVPEENLEDTLEFTENDIDEINNGDQNE
ncbi:MAG: hypothetical protein II625_06260 [Bacilli bacterium]|nr:hypothetical protein [Bacilli bacterium]